MTMEEQRTTRPSDKFDFSKSGSREFDFSKPKVMKFDFEKESPVRTSKTKVIVPLILLASVGVGVYLYCSSESGKTIATNAKIDSEVVSSASQTSDSELLLSAKTF